ncbi:MAG: hypothetical protein KDK39_08355 [Leptospiraceae bacterium]|nr:hypothetical protein [Leptospiraceae bacterium]
MKRCLLLCGVLFTSACTQLQVRANQQPVALASRSSQCQTRISDGHWRFLFGLFRLSGADFDDYAFDASKSYRFTERTTWLDMLITVPLGFAALVGRTTVELQECDEEISIQTRAQSERDNQAAIDSFLRHQGAQTAGLVLQLANGQTHSGQLVSLDSDAYEIESEDPADDVRTDNSGQTETSPVVKRADIVQLKSGQRVVGKITNQSRTAITIQSAQGIQRLDKAAIAKIQFNQEVPDQSPVQKKRIRIARRDVVKIYFVKR